jgi:hypothetical protein
VTMNRGVSKPAKSTKWTGSGDAGVRSTAVPALLLISLVAPLVLVVAAIVLHRGDGY